MTTVPRLAQRQHLSSVRTMTSGTSTDELAMLLDLAPDAMIVQDVTWEIVAVNGQALELFGYDRDELLGEDAEILVPARLRPRHQVYRKRYLQNSMQTPGDDDDIFLRRSDGTELLVDLKLTTLDVNGRRLILTSIRDVTERRRAERAASHFAAVVESSHEAIIAKDLDGRIVSWNLGAQLLYGYTQSEAIGRSISMLVPKGCVDELPDVLAQIRKGDRIADYMTIRSRSDGTTVDVCLSIWPIYGRDGSVTGASTIARDVSAQMHHEKQLEFIAEHDSLTGVHNRHRFERDVAEQVEMANLYQERAALLLLDIDYFKQVNDRLGHRAGDEALKRVARAIADQLPATHLMGRLGGDEFAVLVPYADGRRAEQLAETLQAAVAELDPPGGDESLRLTLSIGYALITGDTVSEEEVLVAADRAMYAAKARRI